MSLTPLDRRKLQRMLDHISHSKKHDGLMKISVGYLIEFKALGSEQTIHLPISPYEDLPRWKIGRILDDVAKALQERIKAETDSPSETEPEGDSCSVGSLESAAPTLGQIEASSGSEHSEGFAQLDTPPAPVL